MDQNLKKIIQIQYDNLPENMKQAIHDADLAVKIQTIGKKYSLLLDQQGSLETEVTLVLLGLEPVGEFVQNIKTNLAISGVLAEQVAREVNDGIFHAIRESLQQINTTIESEPEAISKEDILSEIENPTPVKTYTKEVETKIPTEAPKVEAVIDARNELEAGKVTPLNMIDKKLSAPVVQKPQHDPYREPLI